MFNRIVASTKQINYKMYLALLVLGLCPAIYSTVRVFLLGQLPSGEAFSIAGQLSWVNLLYEVLIEAIILPLYYFIGQVSGDRKAFSNRIKTGLLVSAGVCMALSLCVIAFAEDLLILMAAVLQLLDRAAQYIRIEAVANVFALITQFLLVALLAVNKSKYLYAFTAARLVLTIYFDILLVSDLPVSLRLGVNGIGYSNILIQVLLLFVLFRCLAKEGVCSLRGEWDFTWLKGFSRIGGISALESLVRNLAYMVMISRMVNVVGEQGTYWVANNFIWGWLLLPITQLGELIKQEVSTHREKACKNVAAYLILTAGIVILWFVSYPAWKPFMQNVLGLADVDKLCGLTLLLAVFYVFYAFQNVFDAIFYGLGKTNYMLFESVVTNSVFYGSAFVLYLLGVWEPTLMGIALLFGFGNVFDSVVSLAAYLHLRRKMGAAYLQL